MKNKFDDIIIWSYNVIYSKKINCNIFLSSRRKLYVSKIFKIIFNYIKNCKFENNVLIICEYMYSKKNLYENLNLINLNNDFDFLQIGIDDKENTEIYDKIYSLGAFIINLKSIDINKLQELNVNEINEKFKIKSSQCQIFLHPQRYKNYELAGLYRNVTNYNKINLFSFNFESILTENTFYNYLKFGENPFHKINQIVVSNSLDKFKNRIVKKYFFKNYTNIKANTLFFGLYNMDDVNKLINHKGRKYILWGGSDIDDSIPQHKILINKIVKLKVNGHYSISTNIMKRLEKYNIKSTLIKFNIVDYSLFKPVENLGNSIYIYNGDKPGREYIYGKKYC